MKSAKSHFFHSFLLLLALLLPSCEIKSHLSHRITFGNAVLYNQYIVERHKELIEEVDMYNLAIEHDYSFATKMLDSILIHATQGLKDIQHMAPYKGDSSFREVSADIFKYYSVRFIKEGKRVIELKARVDSGKGDYDEIRTLNELAKKIDMHSQQLQSRLEEIQLRFARKNNFALSGKENNNNEQEH